MTQVVDKRASRTTIIFTQQSNLESVPEWDLSPPMQETATLSFEEHSRNHHDKIYMPAFSIDTTVPSPTAAAALDTRPVSDALWIGIQVYGFIGLSIFGCIVLTAFGAYLYLVVFRRKLQDLPSDLERDVDLRMASKTLPRRRLTTVHAYSAHPARYKAIHADWQGIRATDNKKTSWASSIDTSQGQPCKTGTLDPPGLKRRSSILPTPRGSRKPSLEGAFEGPSTLADLEEEKPAMAPCSIVGYGQGLQSPRKTLISGIPPAHTEPPRTEIHIENRALFGHDLVGTITPGDCESWARPELGIDSCETLGHLPQEPPGDMNSYESPPKPHRDHWR